MKETLAWPDMNASWLPSGGHDKFAPNWCGPVSRNVWPCRSVAHSPRELKVSKGASTRGVAPAPVALAVELEEEHALPGAEAELAVADRDRLAGRAEEHRHAVRVAVPDGHVLLADVHGAAIPV